MPGLRVVAGRFGGRRLSAPPGRTTRPTSERVREAMFSALGGDLGPMTVLDLYAGSGALGIEALSRGASRLVAVESHRAALSVLRRNLAALDVAAEVEVVALPVERARARVEAEAPYGLVLVDPPYQKQETAVRALDRWLAALLEEEAELLWEHTAKQAAPALRGLVNTRTRRYGDTAVSFYTLAPASVPGA